MIVWRRRNDGFEWHKHVRTTIKLRRADRRQRIEDARVAAVDGLKSAGRVSAEAGSSGLSLAGTWMKAAAAALQAGFARLIEAVPPAWAWLRSTTLHGLRAASGPIQGKGVQPVLAAVGLVAASAALIRLLASGWSADAGLMLLVGTGALLAAGLPVMLGKQALPLRRGDDVVAWLSARLSALPLSNRFPRMNGARLASTVVALLVTASAILGGGWLLWQGVALVASASGVFVKSIEGRAAAIAGDVLRIGETEVRLAGIEAPDMDQICVRPGNRRWRCGVDARSALARSVRGATVSCTASGKDDSGRALGTCVAGGEDIAEILVRQGHVFAESGLFSKYASAEEAARTAKEGLWRGEPERPSEYRARAAERLATAWEEAKKTAPGGCPIKARVASGRKHYVLPGTVDYARIRIRARRGERWFCSEEEARAAGWERAPRG